MIHIFTYVKWDNEMIISRKGIEVTYTPRRKNVLEELKGITMQCTILIYVQKKIHPPL